MADHIPEYLQSHVIAGERLAFSLEEQARELLAGLKPEGRNAITLAKQHGASIVLVALSRGNRIADHNAPGVATIQVVSGHVSIGHGTDTVDGIPGTLVVFGPGAAHSLEAKADSAVLVTVAPPGS